ncbi:PRONE domain [Ostreococcus tauri]|uniref:PRONE domain n=1 Tax=Ostreococcus tauri TaxID=70448 RepID=A0A090N3D4_OSTTA|nr:PRONE domain [Ostreococcus tauri]CEF97923.1 PRONE domain [Ostreococcus tauri]|eukprot:XP_003079257.2 PRONE domain [Ostreococcus tauri]
MSSDVHARPIVVEDAVEAETHDESTEKKHTMREANDDDDASTRANGEAQTQRGGETGVTSSKASRTREAIERRFKTTWGAVPLLRATRANASAQAADDEVEEAMRRAMGNESSVPMPGGGSARSEDSSSGLSGARGRGSELAREHWDELRALERQLSNARAAFSSEDDDGFGYARDFEVLREWNGNVLELAAPKPTLKNPTDGLTETQYKKLLGTSQWIRGVLEGATRIFLLSVEAMPTPSVWQASVELNAKEIIGARLYGELNVGNAFNAEALADREAFGGTDSIEDDAVKGNVEVLQMLDDLEKAEAVWQSKLKEQQTIDSLQTIQWGSHSSRAKELQRKLRNSSAYRRVLYARYPNAGLTSLQQMKITRNDDVALVALSTYADDLVRVAAALRARALDVFDAHHACKGEPNPHRRRPRAPSVVEYVSMGLGYTSAVMYDLRKSLEASYDDAWQFVGITRRGCTSTPTAAPADRSPAAIHYVSDVDTDSEDEFPSSP